MARYLSHRRRRQDRLTLDELARGEEASAERVWVGVLANEGLNRQPPISRLGPNEDNLMRLHS